LATIACPGCFGMMFIGQKFCPHCGAKADRQEGAAEAKPQLCPRCRTAMSPIVVGGNQLRECPACEGIWTDTESLRQISADREKQAAVLGLPAAPQADGAPVQMEPNIRYLPCPICGTLMNRVNFANFSGVIVDVCREHGTWFDRDELRRVVEFIRAGGMDKARQREIANLDEDRRLARLSQPSAMPDIPLWGDGDLRHHAVSSLASFILDSLR